MDLAVVGRHALLFDDDAMAAFANSSDALVEWNSLSIDRYDVRHLLSSPLPQRSRNRKFDPSIIEDLSLEAELDHERYLDLHVLSDQPDPEKDEPQSTTEYRAVAFSYGNGDDSAVCMDIGASTGSSEFHPPFPVPGDNISLPQTEKAHQIIAKTALFVSRHGGQSEIILRVKQGDNPTFGFLMPGHELHPYFRFLVEHPELVSESKESLNYQHLNNDSIQHNASDRHSIGGALSLLGSVYDSGEEDADDNAGLQKLCSSDGSSFQYSKQTEFKADTHKSETVLRDSVLKDKEKANALKSSYVVADKSCHVKGLSDMVNSDNRMRSKTQSLLLEPPAEIKRLIGKLVEYVIRNGKPFEAMLIEQDRGHGRFPFLLQSNKFHSYYLKTLREAQELKVKSIASSSHKNDYRVPDKNGFFIKKNDFSHSESAIDDIPDDSEKKEKFKMVLKRPKKEATEMDSNETSREPEFTLDAAAAAAILEAATRGVRSAIISRALPVDHEGSATEAFVSAIKDLSAAALVDSTGIHLTKEQKLKAERLKRAKEFVASLKNRDVPLKAGQSRCSSLEPVNSAIHRDQYSSEGEYDYEIGDHNHHKSKHGSAQEDEYKDKRDPKTRKRGSSRSSSHGHSRLSKEHGAEEYKRGDKLREHKKRHTNEAGKGHKHKISHSHRRKESRHSSAHDTSSEDEKGYKHKNKKPAREGKSRASNSEGTDTRREASIFPERAPSQPPETNAEVSDDFKAKIRAMLLATRL